MPYIDQAARAEIAAGRAPKTPGELNFKLTRIVMNHLAEQGPLSYTACYEVIKVLEAIKFEAAYAALNEDAILRSSHRNAEPTPLALALVLALAEFAGPMKAAGWSLADVLGTLECVKLEFYRRVVAPYEDKKCAENGDAYQPFV